MLDLRWTYGASNKRSEEFQVPQKLSFQNIATLQPRNRPYEVCDTAIAGLRLRVQPSGIKTYLLSYRNAGGVRKRLKIGRYPTIAPAQARIEARKALGAIASGKDPQREKADARLRANSTSLREFVDRQYGPWFTANRRSGVQTLKTIDVAFSKLMRTPLADISPVMIERWRTARLQTGVSPVTVDRELATLKALLSRAVAWQVIGAHPLSTVKLLGQAGEQIVRYLSRDEEKRLRQALQRREDQYRDRRDSANAWRRERDISELPDLRSCTYADHLQPMILMSLNTGLRRGELFRVKWSDVNLNDGLSVLSVRAAAAKSGKPRQVPLNSEAAAALKAWHRQHRNPPAGGLVFEGKDGAQFNNTKRSWERLLKDATIERFRWHDMRHHFASRLVMAGVDLNTVRELLGHGDLKMTLRYAHLAPEHKAAAVEKLVAASALLT